MNFLMLLNFYLIFFLNSNIISAHAGHEYLSPGSFKKSEHYQLPMIRDIYEKSSQPFKFEHNYSLRVSETTIDHPLGSRKIKETKKFDQESPSLNTLEIRPLPSNKAEILLNVWQDSQMYSLRKRFEATFTEGTYEDLKQSKNFSLELDPAHQVIFEKIMKSRFQIEVNHGIEKKRVELLKKETYIKNYELRYFSSQGKTLFMGKPEGIIVIHPEYQFEVTLELTRIPPSTLSPLVKILTLPAEFSLIEEIDLSP